MLKFVQKHVPGEYKVDFLADVETSEQNEPTEDDNDSEEDEDDYQGGKRGDTNMFVENETSNLVNFLHKHVYTVEMSLVDEDRRNSLRCLINATHEGVMFRVASNHEMRDVIIAFAKRAYPGDEFSIPIASFTDDCLSYDIKVFNMTRFQETEGGLNLHLLTFDDLLLSRIMRCDRVYGDEDEDCELIDEELRLNPLLAGDETPQSLFDMDLDQSSETDDDPDYISPCTQNDSFSSEEVIEISDDDDDGDGGDEEVIEVFARESFIDALSRFF